MTHPNHQTNGASLEDCHTNFFALTELCGIKWRKLVWGESGFSAEPLEDPVLASYARCLATDILCVWRRVAAQAPAQGSAGLFDPMGLPPGLGGGGGGGGGPAQPPLSLRAAKELWIFWYGEPPDLSGLVSPELMAAGDGEVGSWESGLSYECRSLLFKALHNLIERCLLSRDFVRLGKWFVQPYDGSEKLVGASTHFSFSFAFFVHGESTVCASMDVRTHPPVRGLRRHHLQAAAARAAGLPVLLAPYGLAGALTGAVPRSADPHLQRLLEDWRQFYPIGDPSPPAADEDSGALPPVVEVVVGGVRMRYPTCYVLVTDMDEPAECEGPGPGPAAPGEAGAAPGVGGTATAVLSPGVEVPAVAVAGVSPPGSPAAVPAALQRPPHELGGHHPACMQHSPPAAALLPERVWQEAALGGTSPTPGDEAPATDVQTAPVAGHWDFADPTRKAFCSCCRLPVPVGAGSGNRGAPLTQQPGTPSGAAGAGQQPDSLQPAPSVGSPASAAPSPLPNPHSQPASVQPADATMPTLSPHPPSAADGAVPPVGGGAGGSVGALPHQPATPSVEAPDKAATPAATPSDANGPKSVSSMSNQVFSPYTGAEGPASAVSGPAQPEPAVAVAPLPALKRPVLSSREYESLVLQEEQPSQLLYDYTTLDAWLNHPVKRFKPAEPHAADTARGPLYPPRPGCGPDLPTGGCVPPSSPAAVSTPPFKQEVKREPMELEGPADPYEFKDDMAVPAVSMEEFKRTIVKEEDRRGAAGLEPAATGAAARLANLYTSEGLQASYEDLDQIFDNSESSSDEALQVPTPPGSNKPAGGPDDTAAVTAPARGVRCSGGASLNGSGSGASVLRPEELSKMFPTPPSMEHNPISSPCGLLSDGPATDTSEAVARFKQDIYPNMGSPAEEPVDDWSYVFRPPATCRFVGSSKYAPLTNLPSQALPPLALPPHCVYRPLAARISLPPDKSAAAPGPRPSPAHPAPGPGPGAHFPPSPLLAGLPLHIPPGRGPAPVGPVGGARTPGPPPPYELPSPATSTASSYLNKNSVNSVEAAATPVLAPAPEASALVVNLLLGDTALNIFRDHNFDSCTLCVCNAGPKVVGNIRGADAAAYLPVPPVPPPPPPSAQPYPPNSPWGGPPPYGLLGASPGGGGAHHSNTPPSDEDSICCSCGFSAVVNRRLSHRSGLFYEDEMEITGAAEDPTDRKKGSLAAYLLASGAAAVQEADAVDGLPQGVLELVREQCVVVQSASNSLFRASRAFRGVSGPPLPSGPPLNSLEFSDSNEVASAALEQGRQAMLEGPVAMCKVEEMQQRQQQLLAGLGRAGAVPCVHRWPHLRAGGPRCNQDIVRVMKSLQPLLQEAIQKKCTTRLWEAPYTVSGPLTWRKFHRLAGRGTDDRCEPQPIPSLVVGYDKDWLSLSPYAVHYWEKLLLEPYSYSRDIAYVVVAPDNEYVLHRVRTFFKELSATYEVCRLGRHCPITKVLRDGILRVGKAAAAKLAKEPVDEWFSLLGDSPATSLLRLYAQVCRHHLAPHLSQVPMDRSLLDPADSPTGIRTLPDRPLPSPMPPPPSTPEGSQGGGDKAPSTPKSDHDGDGGSGRDPLQSGSAACGGDAAHEDDPQEPPAVVVYLVDPFTMGSDSTELQRLACLGLLRCFAAVLAAVPDAVRSNINVQIISLESIVELGRSRDRLRHNDHMRAQAFSVFGQCRRLLTHASNAKALTGFGTAAMAELFLKSKDEKNRQPYRLYAPPYVLAPVKDKSEAGESFGQLNEGHCSVLYVSYCLSEDQRWLLAVATDERGEVFETATINIDIPNRIRRKKASARRVGLQKLMDFILGVMSQSIQPWRLVVGRVGRMGHGELKGWSWLLSRKALVKASKQLKDICSQCGLMYPSDVPCVLSACLVSLEPDSTLRLMPDQFTPDERFSQASVNCQLSTPQDMSCTHILVFPTSATTQSSQTAFQEQHINGPDLDDDLFTVLNDEGIDGMQNFDDIFTWPETGPNGVQSPGGSPRREDSLSQPGSPACGMPGAADPHSPYPACSGSTRGGSGRGGEAAEEVGTLHQQPLALGYFVSTAPTGRMPRWFWASCPHLEDVCPAFLKNALHLHSPCIQQNDDVLQQSSISVHPLDSQYTTDVLRYVLEGYNALSWLALDSNTHDRLSCLPVHVQALMQLYHVTAALL